MGGGRAPPIKQLLHASGVGPQGQGPVHRRDGRTKSRLVWEFQKYIGPVDDIFWHHPDAWPTGMGSVLGVGRDGPHARGIAEADDPPHRVAPSRRRCGATSWTTTSGGDRAAPDAPAGARRPAASVSRRSCSPPGGCSSSASPSRARPSSPSRMCSGPTRDSWTLSSPSSNGRATAPDPGHRARLSELADRRPSWGAELRTSPPCTSIRSRTRR